MTLALVPNLATKWHHLHQLQIRPPDCATCISCKLDHQMAPLALAAKLATRCKDKVPDFKFEELKWSLDYNIIYSSILFEMKYIISLQGHKSTRQKTDRPTEGPKRTNKKMYKCSKKGQ